MKNFIQFINESLITELDYSNQDLKVIPDLPDSLQILWCDNNQLQVLPDLPDSLQILYCRNNQLQVLPDLPDSLKKLSCRDNQLKILPELPDSVQILYCSYNQLQILPELPDSLQILYCHNNPLEFLIPEKFWKQQDQDWLEQYLEKIKSYDFQEMIWEKYGEEHLIQFIKYLDPRIQEKSNLVQAHLSGFI